MYHPRFIYPRNGERILGLKFSGTKDYVNVRDSTVDPDKGTVLKVLVPVGRSGQVVVKDFEREESYRSLRGEGGESDDGIGSR